jgi:Lrp/AsnC family leucine-responsive transcriptional regulator
MADLDSTDLAILSQLQDDGAMTNSELAHRIGLTPAPTLERVRKLEREGYIRKYVALVDQAKLGRPVTAFVSVIMKSHGQQTDESLRKAVAKLSEVLECHHIAGDEDYLLKVIAASPTDYERFVLGKLMKVPGIDKIKTTFVLSSSKLETKIPVEPPKAD